MILVFSWVNARDNIKGYCLAWFQTPITYVIICVKTCTIDEVDWTRVL